MHQLLLQMCRKVKQMNADSVSGATFQAIKGGVIEFIIEIGIKVDPRLLYTTDEMGRTIYIFLHCPTSPNAMDTSRNSTILHMAAMLEPSSATRNRIAGEALKINGFRSYLLVYFFLMCLHVLRSSMFQVILNQTKLLASKISSLF
jgi:hypothetical protein